MHSILQRNRVLIMHAAFWGVFTSLFIYRITAYKTDINWTLVMAGTAANVIPALVISYVNYLYLLPKFLLRKKIWQFILGLVLTFTIGMILWVELETWASQWYVGPESTVIRARDIIQVALNIFFIASFISLLRFANDWMELGSRRKELENEKLTAELNFPKAQVNPHFLFNTLNNLYYLAYTKSDNTTKVIEKLSQMMRYMIYDSNYHTVQLTEEIEYMKNYIALERMRLNDDLPLAFEIEGSTTDVQITPFILITFLENAFKHGVSSGNAQSRIDAYLKVNDERLIYTVENNKVRDNPKAEEKSGIGLLNVKRRLELCYPGKHALDLQDLEDRYIVRLTIDLR